MEICERVLLLRKELKLSQEVFGEKLGMSRSMVVNLEMGKLKNEDQIKRYCKTISSIFNINETWLLTGEGEMTAPATREQQIADVVSRLAIRDEPTKLALISAISRADEEQLRIYLREVIKELKRNGVEFEEE